MQVSVNVVVNAGAYTVGADLMSALVWTGVAGELKVMFWALEEFAAPLLALEVPPVALLIEALSELEWEVELEVSGPTVVVCGPTLTPPLVLLLPWD